VHVFGTKENTFELNIFSLAFYMVNINTDCIAFKSVGYSSVWQNALFLQFLGNGQSG